MAKMQRSRVLEKLRAGKMASCVKLNLGDPRVAEIAAASGIDCIWICLEHVPNDLREVENQIRAAKLYDVDAVVRVPRGSYSDLIRPLEMDATGIMVPHVMSPTTPGKSSGKRVSTPSAAARSTAAMPTAAIAPSPPPTIFARPTPSGS